MVGASGPVFHAFSLRSHTESEGLDTLRGRPVLFWLRIEVDLSNQHTILEPDVSELSLSALYARAHETPSAREARNGHGDPGHHVVALRNRRGRTGPAARAANPAP